MARATCECGHEKRDHRPPQLGMFGYGECKICLCEAYSKPAKAATEGIATNLVPNSQA
ncbi:MAG TPA: hypothetical protein VKW78_15295 [Terriglobales bacterium]|nr:hypothetical protein [Terriglobales bacterium]